MAKDKDALVDPPKDKWDPLFNSRTPIHGGLEVAGSSLEMVSSKFNDIKSILGHPTLIVDIPGRSLPTTANSRVKGHIRPKDQGLDGREQKDSLRCYLHGAILWSTCARATAGLLNFSSVGTRPSGYQSREVNYCTMLR